MPFMPIPIRLPYGSLWLAWNDAISERILSGGFEKNEIHFNERFLKPGMTVLDIGAHHGLYALLASKLVRNEGRVICFEPSTREARKLQWNLRINRCRNVRLERIALGSVEGDGELYVVQGKATACNSMRPPNLVKPQPTKRVTISVCSLDVFIENAKLQGVDYVKLDVEGGELEVLRGGNRLLTEGSPIFQIEIEGKRTMPWGYQPERIVSLMLSHGYEFYSCLDDGSLSPVDLPPDQFDGNFIAVPRSKRHEIEHILVH